MKTYHNVIPGMLLACACAALAAAPAPWYKWRSKVDGKQFCSQTSLGHGWEKASGPYRNGQCDKLITAYK